MIETARRKDRVRAQLAIARARPADDDVNDLQHQRLEIASVEEFHDVITAPLIRHAEVKHTHRVRRRERRRRTGFAFESLPQVKAGRLRALGVTSPARSPSLQYWSS